MLTPKIKLDIDAIGSTPPVTGVEIQVRHRELTPKQRGFGQSVLDGENGSAAYRLNYACKRMSDEAVAVEASRLMRHPSVALMIQEGNEAVSEAILMTRVDAFNEAKTNLDGARAANQWGPANAATKTRIELAGLGTETASPETATDAIIQLAKALSEAQLRGMAGYGKVIDV